MIALRRSLALLRLFLLYSIICFLILHVGLEIRRLKEAGWGLNSPLPPTLDTVTQPPFLGINVAFTHLDPLTRRIALDRLRAAGFGWVRQRFDWGQLEPQPGQFAWTQSDAILQELHSAGLQPVVVLDSSPAWARAPQDTGSNDNPFAPPADPATFARFAAAFAQRYRNQVAFYQIWDEPNIAPHWGNRHIEPIGYAQLLKAAANAIRNADPTTTILTAALAPTRDRGHTAIDELYFLQRLYAAGAAAAFDAVAVQPFGFGAAPADRHEQIAILNFQRIKLVRRVMLAAGDGATPIWAVRFGWSTQLDSPWGTVSPTAQHLYAIEALNIGYHQWPWLTAMGWMIDQPAQPFADPLAGFALTAESTAAMRNWGLENVSGTRQAPHASFSVIQWLVIALAMLAAVWRLGAAARLLPWSTWQAHYRSTPLALQFGLWAVMLTLYYFVTWPPLIGLCWLLFALLMMVQPQVGLYLAALLLPFYYQHKEIQLVDQRWSIAPAHAAILCLLPGLTLYLYHQRTQFSVTKSSSKNRSNSLLTRDWQIPLDYTGICQSLVSKLITYFRAITKRIPLIDSLALIWLLLNGLSSVNVWHWPSYWQGVIDLAVAPLLLYAATRILIDSPQRWDYLTNALGTGGLLVTLFGLITWLQGIGVEVDGVLRLAGPYYSPNQTALYLERTLWLWVGLALAAPRQRWLWWIGGGVVVVALLLTASRGAWLLGLPAGLIIWLWAGQFSAQRTLRPRQRSTLLVLAILSLLVAGAGVIFFRERLANSTTILSRFQIWRTTLDLWQAYPGLGVGPGGFFWRYPAYLTQPSLEPNLYHPHNLWLEFGAIWGVVGLVWLLLLLGSLVKLSATAHRTPLALGLLAGLVAGLAHAQVDTFAALPDLAGWNWLALALLVQQERVMPLRHDPNQTTT